jgi:hypothetical protein
MFLELFEGKVPGLITFPELVKTSVSDRCTNPEPIWKYGPPSGGHTQTAENAGLMPAATKRINP